MTRPVLPNRYSLLSLIGEGGSGRVFSVWDSLRERALALKLVSVEEGGFLRREFDTLRQIRHENLVQVYEWGTLTTGESYYTMELVEGEDWGRKMGQPQQEEEVRRIVTGVLRGVAHLHCHAEIHGDLKPGNILLGNGGLVKVTDVGMGASNARGPGVSGTPGYAAPEVWEGNPPEERSDLYSVGVFVYEALTGKHPFAGKTIREVIAGQMEGWVPSPGAHGVSVPADLERAAMRALERDPGLRYGTADEFMEGIGVRDRVGQILGGRFAGRQAELSMLRGAIEAPGTDGPSVVLVSGEPGVGKSALLQELTDGLHRVGGGAHPFDWQQGLASIQHLQETSPGVGSASAANATPTLSDAAERLWKLSMDAPLVFISDPGPPSIAQEGAWIRELGRYVTAVSRERNARARLLLLIACETPPDQLFDFETTIRLAPLERDACDRMVAGYLGRLALQDEVLSWLHTTTGGNPGMVISAIEALIARGSLVREGGAWRFREIESIRSLHLASLATPWATRWDILRSDDQVAMQALALVPEGLRTSTISELVGEGYDGAALRGLEARGWIMPEFEKWRIASGAAANLVREKTSDETVERLAGRILGTSDDSLDRETRASLMLVASGDPTALSEGIWAADRAMSFGQFAKAASLLERCVELAARSVDPADRVESELKLGDALHQQGRSDEALKLLERVLAAPGVTPALAARGNRQAGEVNAAIGNLDRARDALRRAIALAESAGDEPTFLGAHSALAEIDWRHGDEATRSNAIARMESVVESLRDTRRDSPELASLVYQLGAALIVIGRRERAFELLTPVYSSTTSAYWKMRIANALGTGAYYLGRFDEALEWLDRAWSAAEKSGFDSFKARIHSNRAGLLYSRGRFGEAVESHRTSSKWARRTGSAFELGAALLGASVNLILLADYEEALRQAGLANETSRALGNPGEIAKAVEMQALAGYLIGDLKRARELIEALELEIPNLGGEQVQPRLNWLKARILADLGELDRAEVLLQQANAVLEQTRDWEDLPGVQIEQAHLRARRGDADFRLDSLADILEETEGARAPVVQLQGALAISDCLRRGIGAGARFEEIVLDGLRLAERSGAREYAWRLSFNLGELAARAGDARTAQSRFAAALRIFREVADRLQPSNRRLYLGTAHGALLIERVSTYRPE